MFELIRTTEMKDYNGVGYLYRHDKTGMEVFHIKNDYTELCANFIFSTPSEDSKGVAHIIEHTVLNGSGKYPLKDPFFKIVFSSPNTFLNALTFSDKTMYPLASPLKKDFDILFDIYADAVFNALLRKESFENEGIRFFDGKFDGVVYNEMTGAFSTEENILAENCMKKLYEGTPAQYVSGGDPVCIAELTYEQYLERYSRWYSPSNCKLFLFGDLDAKVYMDKIEKQYLNEEHLKRWKMEKYVPSSDKYIKKDFKPVRFTQTCPTENANSMLMCWLTGKSEDPFDVITLTALTDILLGNPGAPLYKAITESNLGEDLNSLSGMEEDLPGLPFLVGFKGAKEGKEAEVENLILNTLKDLVENGIPKENINASIKHLEFKTQEIPGDGYPFGLFASLRAARSWMRGRAPEEGAGTIACLERLKKEVSKGHFFEDWIQKNLIENTQRSLITVRYDKDYNDNVSKTLKEKYNLRINAVNSEELKKEEQNYNNFVRTPDSPEVISMLDKIKVSDMPEKIPSFEQKSKKVGDCVLYTMPLFTRKIVYVNMDFSILGLDKEEKALLPLLLRLMLMCPTKDHSYEQMGTLIKTYTGSLDIDTSCSVTMSEQPSSSVLVTVKMLSEDTQKALDLVNELLCRSVFDSAERVKAALTDLITEFESDYTYSANHFAMFRAKANFSRVSEDIEILRGTTCFINMKKFKDNFDSKAGELSGKLTALRDKIFIQRGLKIQLGCDVEDVAVNEQIVTDFINKLPLGEFVRIADYYSKPNCLKQSSEVLELSAGPAYNVIVIPFDGQSAKKKVAATMLSSVLSAGYLFNEIRGKNGAYGAGAFCDSQQNIFGFYSYRDPLTDETYEVYKKSLDVKFNADEIESSIVTIIGRELRPMAPGQKCAEAFRRSRLEMTDEVYLERRREILKVTPKDIESFSSELAGICQYAKVTVCSTENAEKIKDKKAVHIKLGL